MVSRIFMVQAALATGALFAFILTRPHRTLYRARGLAKWLGWMGQGGALLLAFAALRELDGAKFAGIKGVRAWRDGEEEIPQAQAQGPEIESDGTIRAAGIYRWTRHPLEWAPALLLLASPVMKTNWLAFDMLAAIYSVAGALHEEKRLGRENPNYAKYQQETAFWVGKPQAKALDSQDER